MTIDVTPEILRAVAEYSNNALIQNWAESRAAGLEKQSKEDAADVALAYFARDLRDEPPFDERKDWASVGRKLRDYIAKESAYTPDLSVEDEWASWLDVPRNVEFYSPSADEGDLWINRGGVLYYKARRDVETEWFEDDSDPSPDDRYAPFRAR